MLRRALVAAFMFVFVLLPPTASAGTTMVTFVDAIPSSVLNGQYPVGVIDWGSNSAWRVAGPWLKFTTNSVSFNGDGPTSGSFTFVNPARLVSVDAFNGG